MIRVPIYKLNKQAKGEVIGYLTYDGKKIIPDQNPFTQYFASKPYSLVMGKERKTLSPDKEPEEWLRNLGHNLHGSYLWAGEAEET